MYKETNPFLESKREFIIDEIYTEYDLYKATLKNNLIKIENELKYPGTVKVTVIRETRCTEEAK